MKFIINKTQTNLQMFGGTLTILRGSFAKVSDQSAETDEVFKLEQLRFIEVHESMPHDFVEQVFTPEYELSKPVEQGSLEYPKQKEKEPEKVKEVEVKVEDKPVAKSTKVAKTTRAE